MNQVSLFLDFRLRRQESRLLRVWPSGDQRVRTKFGASIDPVFESQCIRNCLAGLTIE